MKSLTFFAKIICQNYKKTQHNFKNSSIFSKTQGFWLKNSMDRSFWAQSFSKLVVKKKPGLDAIHYNYNWRNQLGFECVGEYEPRPSVPPYFGHLCAHGRRNRRHRWPTWRAWVRPSPGGSLARRRRSCARARAAPAWLSPQPPGIGDLFRNWLPFLLRPHLLEFPEHGDKTSLINEKPIE